MSFKFGYFLVQKGIFSAEEIDRVCRRQQILGASLDTNLIEMEMLNLNNATELLAECFQHPIPDSQWFESPEPQALAVIPPQLAEKFKIFPLHLKGKTLHLATVDIGVIPRTEMLGDLTGHRVELHVVPELLFYQMLEAHLSIPLSPRFRQLSKLFPLRVRSESSSNQLKKEEVGKPKPAGLKLPSPQKLKEAFRPLPQSRRDIPEKKSNLTVEKKEDIPGSSSKKIEVSTSEREVQLEKESGFSSPTTFSSPRQSNIVEMHQVFIETKTSETPTLTELDAYDEEELKLQGELMDSEQTDVVKHYAEAYLHSNDPEQVSTLKGELLQYGSAIISILISFLPSSLQADLKNEVIQQRLARIKDICEELGEMALIRLLKIIEKGGETEKIRALITIGEWRPPRAIAPLLNILYVEKDMATQRLICNTIREYRGREEFDKLLQFLRENLRSDNIQRIHKALFFLGNLRIVDAIADVIELLRYPNPQIRKMALETLQILTLQNFGPEIENWKRWYQLHGKSSRKKWVVDAMMHPSDEIRKRVKTELQIEFGDDFGYKADDPPEKRERVKQLAALWINTDRG